MRYGIPDIYMLSINIQYDWQYHVSTTSVEYKIFCKNSFKAKFYEAVKLWDLHFVSFHGTVFIRPICKYVGLYGLLRWMVTTFRAVGVHVDGVWMKVKTVSSVRRSRFFLGIRRCISVSSRSLHLWKSHIIFTYILCTLSRVVSWKFLYLLEPDWLFSDIHVALSYAVMLFIR